jgi:hypothetical protein
MVARKATADVPSYAESRGRTNAQELWRMVRLLTLRHDRLEFGLQAVKVLDRKCLSLKFAHHLGEALDTLSRSHNAGEPVASASTPYLEALLHLLHRDLVRRGHG